MCVGVWTESCVVLDYDVLGSGVVAVRKRGRGAMLSRKLFWSEVGVEARNVRALERICPNF